MKYYIDKPDTLIISMMGEDKGYKCVDNIEDADFLVFGGGADIDPAIYGELPHPTTVACRGRWSKARDELCFEMSRYAAANRVPMVGICRGAQYLCAIAGNSLWQDVSGHAIRGTHRALDLETDEWVDVTSTHHQMMRLNEKSGSRILMVANAPSCYRTHLIAEIGTWVAKLSDEPQIEAMLHPHINAVSYQPHPEYTVKGSACRAKFWQYFDTMMDRNTD